MPLLDATFSGQDAILEKTVGTETVLTTFSGPDALLEKTVGTETVLTTLDGIFSLFGALQGIAIQAVLVGGQQGFR